MPKPKHDYTLTFVIAILALGASVGAWMMLDMHLMDLRDSAIERVTSSAPAGLPPQGKPKSDDEWRRILTPEQFYVLREKGTEIPFSSPLDHETRPGTYVSADCGTPLFRSEQKYDSGTGWPSFWAPIDDSLVTLMEDDSIPGQPRVEALDAKCGGHLGHVFDDGPPPTGKRYCINGAALRFIPDAPDAQPK